MKDYVELFDGHKMPIVGLGTWQSDNPEELEAAIETALKAGYRHFDTAYLYQNEAVLGNVLKRWLDAKKVKREELFIVTKLPMVGMRPEHVGHFLKLSLKSLQLAYVDLYLIHYPIGFAYKDDQTMVPIKDGKVILDNTTNLENVWKSMEEQVDNKLAKYIGISNCSISQIERIIKIARIKPANTQVELNAFFQQKELHAFCKKNNMTICAYAPMGSPGRKQLFESRGMKFEAPSLMEDPVVMKVAKKHSRTPAQILLHFLARKEIVVIPKSTNPERVKQNFKIFDFELDGEDVKALEKLDKGESGRTFSMKIFPGAQEHPEFTQ